MELVRSAVQEDDSGVISKVLGFTPPPGFLLHHPAYRRTSRTPARGRIVFGLGLETCLWGKYIEEMQISLVPNANVGYLYTGYLWDVSDIPGVVTGPINDPDILLSIASKPFPFKLIEKWDIAPLELVTPRFVTFFSKGGHLTAFYDQEQDSLWIRYFESNKCKKEWKEEVKKRLAKIVGLLRSKNTKKYPEKLSMHIGADIEYSAFDSDDNFHSATEFVRDNQEGAIGTDGNVETLEIRPDHAKSPMELVDNIEALLSSMRGSLPDGYDLMCGGSLSLRRSTGTHIHFSGISTDTDKPMSVRPDEVISWLDALISTPIRSLTAGWQRGDDSYGRMGDYRCRNNHGSFPHNGFEWRVLPTITINRTITEGVFALAYMIVYAYETGQKIEYDSTHFDIAWYKGLPFFEKYKASIECFVKFVQAGNSWERPALFGWFGKTFKKDRECDVKVAFANDGGYLGIKGFIMYNPQKEFDNVVIWNKGTSSNAISISKSVNSLSKYCTGELGYTTIVESPSKDMVAKYSSGAKNSLFIGIPDRTLERLHHQNNGSRNRIKMFTQDLIKNI